MQSGASIEQRAGSLARPPVLVYMWAAFEDFITAALREAFRPHRGGLVTHCTSTLDVEETVQILPDLVYLVAGERWACIDVKNKVEKHGQHPASDLYPMAAYCRRLGLSEVGWRKRLRG